MGVDLAAVVISGLVGGLVMVLLGGVAAALTRAGGFDIAGM